MLLWSKSPLLAAPTIRTFSGTLPEPASSAFFYRFKVEWENITHLDLRGLCWDEPQSIEDTEDKLTTAVEDALYDSKHLVSLKIELCRRGTLPLGPILLPFLEVLVVADKPIKALLDFAVHADRQRPLRYPIKSASILKQDSQKKKEPLTFATKSLHPSPTW